MSYNNRLIKIVLLIIFFGAFFIRFYRIDNPIADWHSWRQADTSAVSKRFVQEGINPLYPRYFDISNVQTGLDNPSGYRFVEFPLYNVFQAGLFVLLDTFTLEKWGRIVSILSSLGSLAFLYFLAKRHIGEKEAIISAFFFAFLPFSIYYSRVILPDVMMVTATLGGIYFFDRWSEENLKRKTQIFYVLTILFTASSLLLKPYAAFFLLPIVYIAVKRFGLSIFKRWELYIFGLLSLAPFILWRMWIGQYPEGIPVYKWLFNGGDIRFKGSFIYWIFGERIAKLILGYFGIIFLFLGFLRKEREKDYLFPFVFLLSSLLYVFVIARGNVQHDYYQVLIIPTLCLFLGRGVTYLFSLTSFTNRVVAVALTVFVTILTLSLSWYYVRDYFNINNVALVEAGQAADRILPTDAKVIAPFGGDTSLMYYINRSGWPVFQSSIEDLIQQGATHLVIVSPTPSDFSGFGTTYETVASSPQYLILKLTE